MSDALDLVWRRADLPNHILSAAELASWQPDQRVSILTLGLIRRTSDATALICEDCGSPHPVEVITDPRKPRRPYYHCPQIGRIHLAVEDLHRWEADFDQIAIEIRRAAGLKSKSAALVPQRIWFLGRQEASGRCWELFLICGLCWPDGLQLLNQCSRLQQSPAAVILVPHRIPSLKDASQRWPIRSLTEIVSLGDASLLFDHATLVAALGTPGASSPTSRDRVPRKRMSRTLGSPEAVGVVNQYLDQTQMTYTHFANQFQTTDKTLRKFLNSGKMRRSNFEQMASCMGLKADQLLRGEFPPPMKRPPTR